MVNMKLSSVGSFLSIPFRHPWKFAIGVVGTVIVAHTVASALLKESAEEDDVEPESPSLATRDMQLLEPHHGRQTPPSPVEAHPQDDVQIEEKGSDVVVQKDAARGASIPTTLEEAAQKLAKARSVLYPLKAASLKLERSIESMTGEIANKSSHTPNSTQLRRLEETKRDLLQQKSSLEEQVREKQQAVDKLQAIVLGFLANKK